MTKEPNEITSQNIEEWKKNRDVDRLILALEDRYDSNREDAISALNDIVSPKDVQAVEPLVRFLKNGKGYWPMLWAVDALGKLDDPRAVEVLKMYAGFSDPEFRIRAISSLGKINDPQTIEPLERALEDNELKIREEASRALKKKAINQ
jgi:HEAT repeat protein